MNSDWAEPNWPISVDLEGPLALPAALFDGQNPLPPLLPAVKWWQTLVRTNRMLGMLQITDTIQIADWELTEQFMRSSGPGGQNVNKVSTAVELRFEADRSPALTGPVKNRLRRLAGRKWSSEGAIVIQVDETRSQARNREIARERLVEMIRAALVAPKRRVATRPTYGSKQRRLKAKTVRGTVKALRGKVDDAD